jgi:hypothetical protein
MHALAILTLSAFDADLLAVVPLKVARLVTSGNAPFCVPGLVLRRTPADRPHRPPKFPRLASGCLRGACDAVLHLIRLDANRGLAAVLARERPVRHVTLRVASTLYDGAPGDAF